SGTSDEPAAGETQPKDTAQDQGETSCEPAPEDTSSQDVAPEAVPESVVQATQPYRPRLFTVSGTGAGESGRRSRAVTESGRRIGATKSRGAGGSIHLIETVRAAAPHQLARGRSTGPGGGRILFHRDDLRVATKEGHESNLILFCVDASGSMAAKKRMEQVKTAILSLLLDAYQRRDKVGLVTFRGGEGDLVLPPTHSVDIAASRLEELPAGGRTPLAEGLLRAAETLRLERIRDSRRRPLLVVVTDGRATHGPDAVARARQAAVHLASQHVSALVVDCETGRFRMGLAAELAEALMAEHVPVGEVSASALTDVVKGAA
ncbi:MAG: VWA domain-containing protein, partial [Nocardioides sp.]|nr:VWA domain-containing protein [Nocardioides sp.]